MAPCCIPITARYFSVIKNSNNIHIKSINRIFRVWRIRAITVVWVDCTTVNHQQRERKPPHEGRDFHLGTQGFRWIMLLGTNSSQWKSTHTISRALLLLSPAQPCTSTGSAWVTNFTFQRTWVKTEIQVVSDLIKLQKTNLGKNKCQQINLYNSLPTRSVHLREGVGSHGCRETSWWWMARKLLLFQLFWGWGPEGDCSPNTCKVQFPAPQKWNKETNKKSSIWATHDSTG